MRLRQPSAHLPLAALTLALVLGAAGSVLAAPPRTADEWMARAQAQWSDLEYEQVIASAEAAAKAPGATPRQRATALGLAGSALVVIGDEARARATYARMFEADPDYELPADTSPRILAVARPARAAWDVAREIALTERLGKALADLALRASVPAAARGGRPIAVEVRAEGSTPALVARVRLHYRRAGQTGYSSLTGAMRRGGFRFEIPGAFTEARAAYRLEVYVEGLHQSGVALRRDGTREQPHVIQVAPGRVPVPTPLYKRWWVWAGTGAVAVAGALLIHQAIDVGPQEIRGTAAP